jgi:hypothetical protein
MTVTSILIALPAICACNQEAGSDSRQVAPAEVRALVRQLASSQKTERVRAESALLELGPAALPHLPPEELLPSASVRAAVDRVRVALEEQLARESTAAARVTLAGSATVEELLRSISRQSGNLVDVERLPLASRQKRVELMHDQTPFWRAFDQLARQADLQYRIDGMTGRIVVEPRRQPAADQAQAVCYAGAFRIWSPAAVLRPREGANPLLRASLHVAPEPRLRVLFVQYDAARQQAGSGGVNLEPLNPNARYELPLHAGRAESSFQLDYLAPGDLSGELSLRGKLLATVAAVTAPVRYGPLDQLAAQKQLSIARRRGGVTVTLNRVLLSRQEQTDGALEVRLSVAYDRGGPAFESHRAWILHNEVFLEGPEGGQIAPAGGGDPTFQGDGAVAMNYRFPRPPRELHNWNFVYMAPTLIVDVPIEYSLESVPLAASEPADRPFRKSTR